MICDLDKHRVAHQILTSCSNEINSLRGKMDRQKSFFDPSLHSDVLKELKELGHLLSQADDRLYKMLMTVEEEIF